MLGWLWQKLFYVIEANHNKNILLYTVGVTQSSDGLLGDFYLKNTIKKLPVIQVSVTSENSTVEINAGMM